MMQAFEIDIQQSADAQPNAAVGIAISSGHIVFTRLIRTASNFPEDYLEAPPAQLAFWLVDNWWRIRWECVPPTGPTADWRLSHELASIGSYAWPRFSIWGEGQRIGFLSRSDPAGVVGPVRFLTDALVYISADAFETEAGEFLNIVSDEKSGLTSDSVALRAQIDTLTAEREDPDVTDWRRLEAQLGYDVDEAPEVLIAKLNEFELKYGAGGVAEAALAVQGAKAAAVLGAEIAAAKDSHWQCDLRQIARSLGHIERQPNVPPWRHGEIVAAAVRAIAGYKTGPLWNRALAEILNVPQAAFKRAHGTRELAYGLRLNTGREWEEAIALSSRWSVDRRFEFARALGDAIWSEGERLGPLTRAKSERQKFQRAFAQSLLCPHEALQEYIGEDRSDGAMSAAAEYFHVSDRLIRSLLVNKGTLQRHRLGDFAPTPALPGYETAAVEFDEMLEPA